jgi:hypothetical protein
MLRRLPYLLTLLLGAGCASQPTYFTPQAPLRAGLLFDLTPGYPAADQLAWRADWPSVEAGYDLGSQTWYRARLFDQQGFGRRNQGFTIRNFTSYRTGLAVP